MFGIPSIHSFFTRIIAISSPPEGFVLKAENGDRVQHVLKVAKFFAILEKLVSTQNRKRYVFFLGVFIEKFFHDNPLLRVGGLRLANSASDRTSKTSLGFGETNEKFDW